MSDDGDVQAARGEDVDAIRALAFENQMFAPDEMDDFDSRLTGYLEGTRPDDRWIVTGDDDSGGLLGAAYYAPEPESDRVWNLYFIAVRPDAQRRGVGARLLRYVEGTLRDRGPEVARSLIVETSSLDQYTGARAFYAREGYTEVPDRVADAYGPGDDMVVFNISLESD